MRVCVCVFLLLFHVVYLLKVGAFPSGEFPFDGRIGAVAFFGSALSNEQIADLAKDSAVKPLKDAVDDRNPDDYASLLLALQLDEAPEKEKEKVACTVLPLFIIPSFFRAHVVVKRKLTYIYIHCIYMPTKCHPLRVLHAFNHCVYVVLCPSLPPTPLPTRPNILVLPLFPKKIIKKCAVSCLV